MCVFDDVRVAVMGVCHAVGACLCWNGRSEQKGDCRREAPEGGGGRIGRFALRSVSRDLDGIWRRCDVCCIVWLYVRAGMEGVP